jgi:hypothetical protein
MSRNYYIYGYSFKHSDLKSDPDDYYPVLEYLKEFLETNIVIGAYDQRPVVGYWDDGVYYIGLLSSSISTGEVKNTSPCNLSVNVRSALIKAWAKLDYFKDSARLEPGYYFF